MGLVGGWSAATGNGRRGRRQVQLLMQASVTVPKPSEHGEALWDVSGGVGGASTESSSGDGWPAGVSGRGEELVQARAWARQVVLRRADGDSGCWFAQTLRTRTRAPTACIKSDWADTANWASGGTIT